MEGTNFIQAEQLKFTSECKLFGLPVCVCDGILVDFTFVQPIVGEESASPCQIDQATSLRCCSLEETLVFSATRGSRQAVRSYGERSVRSILLSPGELDWFLTHLRSTRPQVRVSRSSPCSCSQPLTSPSPIFSGSIFEFNVARCPVSNNRTVTSAESRAY